MSIIMGPVLNFRGIAEDKWCVSALCVLSDADAAMPMNWGIGSGSPSSAPGTVLKRHKGMSVVRFDHAVPQTLQPQTVAYQLTNREGEPFRFVVPRKGAAPRCAYASCNGFSDPKAMNKVRDKNALWKSMDEEHDKDSFHLLLMGGDQVYADSIWKVVPSIEEWSERDEDARLAAPFTDQMRDELEKFYFDLYCQRWQQVEVAKMFASIPTVMMWDDHDIFDGWGSYPTKLQSCAVYRGIFRIASEHFAIFQQQVVPDENRPMKDSHPARVPGQDYFSLAFEVGPFAIVALDMRSERTIQQVMTNKTWDAVDDWLQQISDIMIDHLLVMSSIPVAHPDLSWAEDVFGWLPGQQELEDDLRDHWNSHSHKEERVKLIHRLLDIAQKKKIRATIVSGDVHVAANGAIQSRRNSGGDRNASIINQLTSSAIVHPAPPRVMNMLLELIGRSEQEIDRDIYVRMLKFAGTSERFLTQRNWLSLEPDQESQPRIWAIFHVENDVDDVQTGGASTVSYTKVVHPIEKSKAVAEAAPARAA